MKIILNGKPVDIAPPVFRTVKQVLLAYNALATSSDDKVRYAKVIELLALLVPDIKARSLKEGELLSFLDSIPDICGLEKSSGGKALDGDSWGYLYAHLSMCFGWDYDYIDSQMTFFRLKEYQFYLEDNPSVHLLVKAYLGYEPKRQQTVEDLLREVMEGL